ncbi:MAG: glycosyltransferase family 4 protein [Patescibacteria group bacterium]|nr:glycosyltransferase family 4 protein [Patescibacteria group bacterium]
MSIRKLKIAQIAPLWIRVPPVKYGGTELIVYHLCEELTRRGHDVTLFGPGNSLTSAKLVAGFRTNLLAADIPWSNQFDTLRHLAQAFARTGEFDIVHSHVDLWETFFAYFSKVPVVHTIHNPLYSSRKNDLRLQILSKSRWSHYVTISNSQYRLGSAHLNRVGTVYNGMDLAPFHFNPRGSDHFIWIARVDPYKGIENAIAACEQAKVPLVMAGRLDVSRRKYFRQKIKPHLKHGIRFIGEINAKQKNGYFGNAKALLYPIEWHEPFGLVMIEAMACGTPVIAYDMGSVREVVKDGVTGFVVKTIPEMVRAMKKINTIDRTACRAWVEKKFSIQTMVDGYEKVYERILRRKYIGKKRHS